MSLFSNTVVVSSSYKHAIDGLYKVFKHEGTSKLFNGATMATSRAVCVTVGQIACYDQIKLTLLGTAMFKKDNEVLHFASSFMAVSICIKSSNECKRDLSPS